MERNIKKRFFLFIALVFIISIIIIVYQKERLTIFNNGNEIVILDQNGDEYYKIKQPLKDQNLDETHSERIVLDNGFVDSVVSQVIDDMVEELGYSRKSAIKELNTKGLIINSTIDTELQRKIDEVFSKRSTFTSREKGDYNQSSMVIMDYKGNIKAMSSGNNEDKTRNRATKTLLKVGSTIKPVAIYTPAIEDNIINFSSIIDDIPSIAYNEGKAMEWPQNYDNKYEMNVTITDALQKSKNTIAVNVGKIVGENKIFDFLQNNFGYSTLVDSKIGNTDRQLSALALGHLINGVTLDTLVGSYQIFGNGGYYSKPNLYTIVKDRNGNVVIENKIDSKQVISEETATIMNRLLYNNINEEGSIIKNINIDGVEVLGKTGTVGEGEDTISQLFVGMTPDYIAGVWSGYDDGRPLIYNSYNSPTSIWQQVMEGVKVTNSKFKLTDKVVKNEYCSISGLLKTDKCKISKIGYYKYSDIPDSCNICK